MLNRIGIALGAGLASALLFVVTMQATAIAILLAYLTPLPIMIATLGWGLDAGAIAVGVACAVVAGAIEPFSGFLFALTIALPAWGLSAFANLRTVPVFRRAGDPEAPARASVGALVVAAAALGVAIGAGGMGAMILFYGGYEKGVAAFADLLQPTLQDALDGPMRLPDDLTVNDLLRMVVKFSPAAIAASTTLMLLVNLYAAARSAQTSQRLNRPWPDVPTSLILPPALAGLAVAALAIWLAVPEPVNQFAAILVGALGVAYVLQGLAVLHALSRRVQARPALIAALYLACLVAPRWVLPAIAIIGLIESFASLRARATARPFRP